ncbi:hypothetical protein [Bacillus sp. T33-2]|uniref:hypothetical protein n=1 Tax=Bacillus sp. T33-2 TaxID=2054168 RepID=UPI000C764947|nr:hypothetical protein [Bacillus sp. T33-2]PLR98217.1 hypothetical protein CVD19_06375 [Bacillus sp. T33-2]
MKKIALSWSMIICLLAAVPGLASAENHQNALQMEELTIQVMPEFSYHPKDKKKNRPPLLVGYHVSLKNNTDKPQKGQIEVPIPIKDKNFRIGYVADYSLDLTEMNEINYQLDKQKGTISWETSEEIKPEEIYKFVIEFYTDSINESKDSKTLDYKFESFADTALLNLIFVEPLKTDSFTLKPEAESHQKNTYNMNMFLYQAQGMKPGEKKEIQLKYKRAETRTTGEIMDDKAGESAKQTNTTNNEEKMPLWIVVSVVGGVTAVAAVLLIFVLRSRANQSGKKDKSQQQTTENVKKTKLRSMLLDGRVTEEEYNALLKKLGGQ